MLGAAVSLPAALDAGGLATAPRAVAVVVVLWLVALLALPWAVTRSRTWTDPALDTGELVEHAAQTRRTLDAGSVAGGLAAAAGLLLLCRWAVDGTGGTGSGMVLGFVSAVSLAAVLRARRSVFVVESASAFGVGVVGLAGVGGALVVAGSAGTRAAVVVVLVLLVGVLVALSGALRVVGSGDDQVVAAWHRPRTQRLLGWLETTAAVAVLPLLAGVLGVYAAAADAGARF